MVTRTITSTKVNVLCLELEKVEPFNKVVILPGTFKGNKAIDKAVHKVIDNDEVKVVHVVDVEVQENLFGMTEQEFIEHAKVLPPRDKKEA